MERTLPDRTNVWLVRHGESTWNAQGLCQGQSDIARLTSRGQRQAVRVLESLEDKDVELVHSSDLHRARQTAAVIASGPRSEVVADERLRERGFGVAEGSPFHALTPEWTGIRGDRVVDVDARPTASSAHRAMARLVTRHNQGRGNHDSRCRIARRLHGAVPSRR